jgi:CO/xanthine dehydrogenase Mo-binding subunit
LACSALRSCGLDRAPLGEARVRSPARINAQFAYVGGGFGGRDHTPFVLYVALAAMFFAGRPVRLARDDRYQQFQGGIKRHPFKMRSWIGVDRATGKIRGLRRGPCPDGGGLANYSTSVAVVGATAAIGIMTFRKSTLPPSRCTRAAYRWIDARLRHGRR